VTAGGTDAALLQRIEAYFDAVPRPAAGVEQHGPLTLFISRIPWRFYGRPRMGLAPRDAIGADDVRALRARQRALGVREALEWVAETTPSLAGAARATGMEVVAVPLSYLFLPADAPVPSLGTLLLALIAGNVGLAALGSLVAAVASAVRGREVMVPLLFLPAAVPLLIACLACSVNAADGDSVVRPLALVLLYDAIVGLLAYAVCEHALTD